MRPLQDQCEPTPYEDLEKMFISDIGISISDYFDEFDPIPIGVASLAQVHVGKLKGSGERVAVKLQHPHLEEFCEIDMEMVEVSLGMCLVSLAVASPHICAQGGSNTCSLSSSSLGWARRCARTCQRRWTSCTRSGTLSARWLTSRMCGHPCTFVSVFKTVS